MVGKLGSPSPVAFAFAPAAGSTLVEVTLTGLSFILAPAGQCARALDRGHW